METRKAVLADLIRLHEKGELVGVFEISNDDYHNAPGISKSGLDKVDDCPAYYDHCRRHPEEPSDAMELGNALHTAILEPEHFDARYVVADQSIQRRGTKDWNAVVDANPGKVVLKFDQGTQVEEMVRAARGHSRSYLLDGKKELSFFWKDPDTGLVCKCRTDIINLGKKAIVDYKSAVEIYPARAWSAALARQRYHVQAAWYLDGVRNALEQSGQGALVPTAPDCFIFFAQKKDAPYFCKPWLTGNATVMLGRREYQANLKTIAECEQSGRWPAYPEKLETCEAPEWVWSNERDEDDGGVP